MGSDQEQPKQEPPPDGPREFFITFGKALLTAILGIAALLALAATVCGTVLNLGGPQGGRQLTIVSAIVLIALIYAIRRLWR